MTALQVDKIGPAATLQDLGRPGYMAQGLSLGGAADRLAIVEGAVLLDQPDTLCALEMPGFGGQFTAQADLRIALTGAPMPAMIDGAPIAWNASHRLAAGQVLTLGATRTGNYGYLHVGGGFQGPDILGSPAAHLVGGLGGLVAPGQRLSVGPDTAPDAIGQGIEAADRFSGGVIRMLPSTHTRLFAPETLERFQQTLFHRTLNGNRQGAELGFDGDPFATDGQLSILSDVAIPGDIQMTGTGRPYVLLPECQTSGGYPRIGCVVPDDLPRVVQATPGVPLSFRFVAWEEAQATTLPVPQMRAALQARLFPLIRDPASIRDLLSYQLISGVTAGRDGD